MLIASIGELVNHNMWKYHFFSFRWLVFLTRSWDICRPWRSPPPNPLQPLQHCIELKQKSWSLKININHSLLTYVFFQSLLYREKKVFFFVLVYNVISRVCFVPTCFSGTLIDFVTFSKNMFVVWASFVKQTQCKHELFVDEIYFFALKRRHFLSYILRF